MGLITSVVYDKIKNIIGKRSTITHYINTETYDPITRSKTDSYDTGTTRSGIFLRREALIKLFEEGALEEGDAYVLFDKNVTVARHDKIKIESAYFLIDDVITRYWGDNVLFKSCRCTFLGDA